LTHSNSAVLSSGFRCSHSRVDKPGVGASPSGAEVPALPREFPELLAQAQDGSPPACRWLYESLAGRVAGYLRLHGSHEPDDLTSEVFLRVFDHLLDFEGDEAGFRSWVFTIAHRLLIDEHRRNARRPHTVELSVPVSDSVAGGNAESEALVLIEDQRVNQVLAGLAPDQREVLSLRIVGDLTIDQIANVLGKSRGSIKSLQHRGVAALRRRLREATP
jgi:RNA polymerase sigma factor (sigma-70 family)